MKTLRLIDAGTVSPLRSQTIWHGLAYAMEERNRNTISMMSPIDPYICIGYHQEVEKEVDLDFCHSTGLPVLRREVGGGAVYLDNNQLFVHFVFHRGDVPPIVEEVYRLFASPIVETYRALGIDAAYRPINDIQVAGRKIGGMGAAIIGEAMVVASSLMFDFDHAAMAGALKVSSEKMRDKVYQGLQEYITTMRRELGGIPSHDAVKRIFVSKCEEVLGLSIERNEMTSAEHKRIEQLDGRFSSSEWLHQKEGIRREGIKIQEGVQIVEGVHKAQGGLIRATVRLREEKIDDLTLSGDFTMIPGRALPQFEMALRGVPFDEGALTMAFDGIYRTTGVQSPGVTSSDFVWAILAPRQAA